jgi:hypothetical protein
MQGRLIFDQAAFLHLRHRCGPQGFVAHGWVGHRHCRKLGGAEALVDLLDHVQPQRTPETHLSRGEKPAQRASPHFWVVLMRIQAAHPQACGAEHNIRVNFFATPGQNAEMHATF